MCRGGVTLFSVCIQRKRWRKKNACETELGEARAKLAQQEIDHELELDAERVKTFKPGKSWPRPKKT